MMSTWKLYMVSSPRKMGDKFWHDVGGEAVKLGFELGASPKKQLREEGGGGGDCVPFSGEIEKSVKQINE